MTRRKLHPFVAGGRLQLDVAAMIRTGFLRETHEHWTAQGFRLVEKVTVRIRADATVDIPIRWRRSRDVYTEWVRVSIAAFFAAAPPAREDTV